MSNICISRTDNLGDVILTLPIAGFLKKHYPESKIFFLGKNYTQSIIENCTSIDQFLNWDHWQSSPQKELIEEITKLKIEYFFHVFPNKKIAQLAKIAKIPNRVGTSHRTFHWLTCNKKVSFSRKNSPLHEAQLNFELLKPFYKIATPSLEDLISWTNLKTISPSNNVNQYTPFQKTIILHAKSKGSAIEWGIQNFSELALQLSRKGYQVLFTGSADEGNLIKNDVPKDANIKNICGLLSLSELISLIQHCYGLVACSTGPLHIAAAAGVKAIGLFSTKKPIHPGRWQALGVNAHTIVFDPSELPGVVKTDASDIAKITPQMILNQLL